MKSFASASFFRLFDVLMDATNPHLKLAHWTFEGVNCEHERHSFNGHAHGFVMETFTLTRPGRRGWALLVVKEYWWVGEATDAIRLLRWARPTSGRRSDVLEWLRAQQLALDRRSNSTQSVGESRNEMEKQIPAVERR
jgi:hypothetical protein